VKRVQRAHRFSRWRDFKIICTCGWESRASFHAAISELSRHIAASSLVDGEAEAEAEA
jgi:hypothetical protein